MQPWDSRPLNTCSPRVVFNIIWGISQFSCWHGFPAAREPTVYSDTISILWKVKASVACHANKGLCSPSGQKHLWGEIEPRRPNGFCMWRDHAAQPNKCASKGKTVIPLPVKKQRWKKFQKAFWHLIYHRQKPNFWNYEETLMERKYRI